MKAKKNIFPMPLPDVHVVHWLSINVHWLSIFVYLETKGQKWTLMDNQWTNNGHRARAWEKFPFHPSAFILLFSQQFPLNKVCYFSPLSH